MKCVSWPDCATPWAKRLQKHKCITVHVTSDYQVLLQGQCLTAAGLNPKFLATKDEVMQLIGDRQNVLEGELRRRMGNNPDTSKALRYYFSSHSL